MSESKVVQLRRGDAYAGMPGGRKGKNLAPTKDQFRELHRLCALLQITTRALAGRIGHHLPVTLIDQLLRFAQFKTLLTIRSKLDDWACRVEPNHAACWVFFDEGGRAHVAAQALVDQFLSAGTETLPDGFMEEK
jgi:hypothetical protein